MATSRRPSARPGQPSPALLTRAVMAVLAAACLTIRPAQAAVDAGRPACDYCRMLLTEPAFGGEIRLRSGAVRSYDSIECMAAAVLTDSVAQRDIRGIAVVDHDAPHARLPLAGAALLHCPRIESPMGLGLSAFHDRVRARRVCPAPAGSLLDWQGVLAHVNRVWFLGKLSVEGHPATGGRASRASPGRDPCGIRRPPAEHRP